MVDREKIAAADNDDFNEEILRAYEIAVNICICEAELCWSRFNAMLVANSVILAMLGLGSERSNFALIAYILPMIGIVLCLCWRALMRRGFDYHRYYLLSARELEEQLPSSKIRTLSRGSDFAAGRTVYLRLGNIDAEIRMSRLSRQVTIDNISKITISLFICVYVAALWQFLFFK